MHGLQSHGEWFVGTCGSVADQGFDVIALDRRGSGLSQGPREHMDRITHVVRDHRLFLEWLRSQDPDLPIILFAHSWGGLLGVFLAGYPRTHDHVNGLVLISPGLIGRRRMISKWA
ncbi:MAG: alpha/beta fold hydrolase, partial [Myxococcales bacterium]|nr:alpha/beta fold hydrolase [Myxococcales bacterium]